MSFEKIAPYLSNPLVLVGFVLLLFFGVHRTLVRSGVLPPVSKTASRGIVRLLLHYGFAIALVVIVLGFGMAALRESLKAKAIHSRPLSRVEAEEVLQTQRGSIERCLARHRLWTSLNFVFQPQSSGILNVDVFTEVNPQVRFLGHTFIPPGTYNPQELDGALDHSKILGLTDSPSPKDKEWIKETLLGGNPETPATKFRIEGTVALVEGLGDKLSIADPDSNRCILSSIGSSIGQFTTTANDQPLIHRYITDAGVEKAKTEWLQRKDNDQ
jgi:hypothetical protein